MLGLTTFLVRKIFPVGWVLEPAGFQLGYFPQYIGAFILGLIAAEDKWIEQVDQQRYLRLGIFILGVIVIGFPICKPLPTYVACWPA